MEVPLVGMRCQIRSRFTAGNEWPPHQLSHRHRQAQWPCQGRTAPRSWRWLRWGWQNKSEGPGPVDEVSRLVIGWTTGL